MLRKPLCLIATFLIATGLVGAQDPIPSEAAFEQSRPRLDKLSRIAGQLHDPEAKTEELLTEAAKLCGFSIWTEDRKPVAESIHEPRLGYAITTEDIKWFSQMQKSRHSVKFGDVVDTLDYLYKELGGDGSVGPRLRKTLTSSWRHPNASVRAWGSFLKAVNSQNPDQGKAAFATAESVLSPVEALFILRVFTEDMTMPLRRWLKTKEKHILYASMIQPMQGGIISLPSWAEGWGEDAGSAGISAAWEWVVENVDLGFTPEAIARYRELAGRMNLALSLLKVIQTYACLESRFWVESPGAPLIRTTDTNPGDTRLVASQWYFDMPKLQDFLKENRWFGQVYGIDADAPHSGPLAGVETDWQIIRYGNILDIPVTMKGGLDPATRTVGVDPSKVVTDTNGVARVEFEGKPQNRRMNRNQVAPEDKEVELAVTPQTKAVTIEQDVVDALTGALGIQGGGLGLVTPLIESLYRLKWVGTKTFKLKVRDWVPGETRGSVTIWIKGYGESSTPNGRSWERIDRYIEFKNVVMEDIGVSPPPALPPRPPGVSDLVWQQINEGHRETLEASRIRPFVSEGPGQATRYVNDADGNEGYGAGGCGEEPDDTSSGSTTKGRESKTFAAGDFFAGNVPDIGFAVSLHLDPKIAVVQVQSMLEAIRETTGGDGGTTITSTQNLSVDLLRELNFKPEGIDVPISVSEDVGSRQVMFRGTRTGIPFKFGPDDKYTGHYAIIFKLIRVPKKP